LEILQKVVVFGSLIKETNPVGIDLEGKIVLTGLGFGHQGVPIDIITTFFAGIGTKEYHILITDVFHMFN